MMKVVGEWRLLSWRRIADDGTITFPLGEDAVGFLVYAPTGRMIVQMSAASRQKIDSQDPLGGEEQQRAAAYSGYLAYFGSYQMAGADVTHRIESSSFPNWSGTLATRPFERHPDTLVLRTPPGQMNGVTVVNEMSWVRDHGPSGGDNDASAGTAAPSVKPTSGE